jgi:excisionase family DNA binding protein
MIPRMDRDVEQLYSAIDVARALNVSTQRVRQLVEAGNLRAWRTPGGERIFRRTDVERFAEERRNRVGNRPSHSRVQTS